MVQMFIHKVILDPQGRALVFLVDADNRRALPIWIGIFEAHAILSYMREAKFPRPMTHDLLKLIIEGTGYAVKQVRVTRLEDNTFFALIDLTKDSTEVAIDARPSDAMALALRADAPIFVAEEVLQAGEILTERAEEDEMETFRKLMESVPVGDDSLPPDSGEAAQEPEGDEESPEGPEE